MYACRAHHYPCVKFTQGCSPLQGVFYGLEACPAPRVAAAGSAHSTSRAAIAAGGSHYRGWVRSSKRYTAGGRSPRLAVTSVIALHVEGLRKRSSGFSYDMCLRLGDCTLFDHPAARAAVTCHERYTFVPWLHQPCQTNREPTHFKRHTPYIHRTRMSTGVAIRASELFRHLAT